MTDDAFLRVVAHDVGANTAADESDAAFAITDPPTGTLLALFVAEALPEGIRVRWQLGDALQGSSVTLQRADAANGPWSAVPAVPRAPGGVFEVIDRTIVAGRTYHYRLDVRSPGGATMSFGPLSATAGVPITEFALAPVAPNPASGNVRFDLALPRESDVRLAVLDVQGREIAVLIAGAFPSGRYHATWSGAAGAGPAPAGVYYARCRMGGKTLIRRLVLVR
jgi:hypothetical protein